MGVCTFLALCGLKVWVGGTTSLHTGGNIRFVLHLDASGLVWLDGWMDGWHIGWF